MLFKIIRCAVFTGIVAVLGNFSAVASEAVYRETVFFVVAHEDDWQLFMGTEAWRDILDPEVKVVFVYATAGDDGCGTGPSDVPSPYFQAREAGAEAAIRLPIAARNPLGGWSTQAGNRRVTRLQGHDLQSFVYANTVSYYLRLPDGFGKCFQRGRITGARNALLDFVTGQVRTPLQTVDGSATYETRDDVVSTLASLFTFERVGSNATAHLQDPDTTRNLNDHPDHIATGHLAEEAAAKVGVFTVAHLDYAIAGLCENISSEEASEKAALFGATVVARADLGWPGSWDDDHRRWLTREYDNRTTRTCVRESETLPHIPKAVE